MSPAILFWALPYLMMLLLIGTLAQAEIGIYEAQNRFFSSLILWVGPIPLPGGLAVSALIFLNLLAKFIFDSPWSLKKTGINLTHLGVLVLLIGGVISTMTRQEAALPLPNGEAVSQASSYIEADFLVRKNGDILKTLPFEDLSAGQKIEGLPFDITMQMVCENCDIVMRPENESQAWQGPSASMKLVPSKSEKQAEENLQGVAFEIDRANDADNGKYQTFSCFPQPPEIEYEGDIYQFTVERRALTLPFEVRLNAFAPEFYPGTNKARSYHSDITVTDGNTSFEARIAMNEPLRFKGYTLYQTSYFQNADGSLTSVLSVVKNKGRIFPYIATGIILAGLLFHVIITGMKKKERS